MSFKVIVDLYKINTLLSVILTLSIKNFTLLCNEFAMKNKNSIKRIAVFTSGGDAPGMNACLRAVVRTALFYDKKVTGIYRGYQGMIDGDFEKLNSRSVSNIIQRGGTIIKTARCESFKTAEGREQAYQNLVKNEIDAVVAIGGDGTFTGAWEFMNTYDIPFVGVPGTIDNDLFGTDYTIGYDTATNTAMEAIDKIRDTASSHNRLFFIEVMGRNSGAIALRTAIAAGAEAMMIPEKPTSVEDLIKVIEKGEKSNKSSSMVVVAEGGKGGKNLYEIVEEIKKKFPEYDPKLAVIGHTQRGGSPTCFDRLLASRLGVGSVESLLDGKSGVMVGMVNDKITYTPFDKAIHMEPGVDEEIVRISKILAL